MVDSTQPRARWSRADIILLALVILLPLLFYAVIPILGAGGGKGKLFSIFFALTHAWTSETNYEHGWLILPAMAAIIYKAWPEIRAAQAQRGTWGIVLVILALALYVVAVRLKHWRIAAGALPILIYGIIYFLWGRKKAAPFIFPLCLFYFCVPVPDIQQATNNLQLVVTSSASKLAAFSHVPLIQAGNRVTILGKGDGDFDVNEGCSGIRSLMALLMIAFVYGHFAHQRGWKRMVIFFSAMPLAILANILRIYSILMVANYFSVDFAKTIYHDKVGFFSFALALGLLLLLSRILEKGFRWKRPAVVVRQAASKPVIAEQVR